MNQVISAPTASAPVTATTAAQPTMMEIIAKAASDPTVDVAKLERLLDMAERVQAKQAREAYAAAMTAAQSEMRHVAPDLNNTQTTSRYASYAKLDLAVRPIYTKHGFSVSFTSDTPRPDVVRVVARVKHALGHEELHHLDIPADGKGARGNDVMTKTHAAMSAVTYGRRGLLKMIFNLSEGKQLDDDGNGASAGNFITDKERDEIEQLLAETKAERSTVLGWIKADSVASIRSRDFVKVRDALVSRRNIMRDAGSARPAA